MSDFLFDIDIAKEKIAESASKVIHAAFDYATNSKHAMLTSEHLLYGFIVSEWDLFTTLMVQVDLNPSQVLKTTEEDLREVPRTKTDNHLSVLQSTKLVLKMALLSASRSKRSMMESHDICIALTEETNGLLAKALRKNRSDPNMLQICLQRIIKEKERTKEQLDKKFELPPFLKHFAVSLNHLARLDKIPPSFGREAEVQRVFEILCHVERANSPLLIGEAGVGKTSIAEGVARLIELEPDRVPPRLRKCQIVSMQMNAMVAGTMLRGMFEDRIQNVIKEIKERPNLILFIDEVHTMVGAGSALGAPSDAAQMFKSVMARGEVRIIGATTSGEYKEFIQQDEALSRRFITVTVDEADAELTRLIVTQSIPRMERNYGVKFDQSAVELALDLAPRYQRSLHSPDKQLGWLDTAAVKASANGTKVKTDNVQEVIAQITGLPISMVTRKVASAFRNIEDRLSERMVGQRAAIQAVANKLRVNKGPLKENFNKPDGVLLFMGPTGVGKTELAKALAEFLFGDENRIIRIDMSEYHDLNAGVDKLIGFPKGIIGADRGGLLTNPLKDHPYSVVLLDEVEKTNQAVLNVFLKAFDEGWITDGLGKRVYLSDAIVIMTSNIGSEYFTQNPFGFGDGNDSRNANSRATKALEQRFSPEFRNRIDEVVIFNPLTKEEVGILANRYLDKITATLRKDGKELNVAPEALEMIIKKGYSAQYGARFLKRVLEDTVKVPISRDYEDFDLFTITAEQDDIKVISKPTGMSANGAAVI